MIDLTMEGEKKTILLVDDMQVNRAVLKDIIGNEYNVIEAGDGEEALSVIRSNGGNVSLIILDNHMPKMTGIEFMRKVHKNPWLKRIPVVMISADNNEDFALEAFELGVVDFFSYPFSPAIVMHRIRYALNNYERRKKEVYNMLRSSAEFYYILMQANLKDESYDIIETTEEDYLWDKDISEKISDALGFFLSFDYIYRDDLEKFKEFNKLDNIRKAFEKGNRKIHLEYRRKYEGEYRWAIMEVTASCDYTENNPVVIYSSRDITAVKEAQQQQLDSVSLKSAFSDYCNISKDIFYHHYDKNFNGKRFLKFDTITDVLEFGASQIPVEKHRKELLETFSLQHMLDEYKKGNKVISMDHLYKNEKGDIALYKTTVQMIQNAYTKDIEGIYYIENISADFLQKKIEESLYDEEYMFIGVLDINKQQVYMHKAKNERKKGKEGTLIDYDDLMKYGLRSNVTGKKHEFCQKMMQIESIEKALERMSTYEFVVDCVDESGIPMSLQYVYRYLDKELGMVICMAKNISELAELDSMTGGMNTKGFERKADYIFKHTDADKKYSILYFDIKEFKAINEILGYEEGNEVIKKVWNILSGAEFEPVLIARAMADQFVCLVETDKIDYDIITKQCRIELFDWKQPVIVRLHCGIYNIQNMADDVHSMCDRAKIAEKHIENEFTKPYAVYESFMNDIYINQMLVINSASDALRNKEFKVFYQPIYDAKSEKIVSAETLVRWFSPSKGMINPGMFIPALEEKGTISQLDLYMAQNVHDFMIKRKNGGKQLVPLSVNLSRMDFFNVDMLQSLIDMLEESVMETNYFRFEVTESAYVDINDMNDWALKKISKLGSKILIDDFGTGYSSLANIAEQDFDILKIDMSFIKKIGENRKVEAVIKSVISMSHEMGARVVAEGVETEKQLAFLRENGCDFIQGYYFSKPLPEEEFEKLLDEAI